MNRTEFIDKLRVALAGKLPVNKINEQVDYYNNYIMSEVRKGRIEEEVIESLGDPRLIAKSIIASEGGSDKVSDEYYSNNESNDRGEGKIFSLSGWPAMILLILIALFVVWLVVKIAIFLLPVVILVAAVLGIVYLIRNMNK